jgi:hypothetical protein
MIWKEIRAARLAIELFLPQLQGRNVQHRDRRYTLKAHHALIRYNVR